MGITGCKKTVKEKQGNNSEAKYTVYYFHPTARCESCINLENFTKELVENKYAAKGFLFKEINTELSENEHFKKDYDLKFSSVVLVNSVNGLWKNLDSVWSFTDNKEKFFIYAEREINTFMN